MAKTAVKAKPTTNSRSKRKKTAKSSLVRKTLHRADGERVSILSIDANSPTFDSDLGLVFQMNVAKARRENVKARAGLSKKA